MNFKHYAFLIFIVVMTKSCTGQQPLDAVAFLEGTWKMENKETYEQWQIEDAGYLAGSSFKMKDGNKKVLETLKIRAIEGQLIYEATVPNQNQGKTIAFTHNSNVKDCLSFENLEHDFPKKIQYKKLDESTILVQVLGEGDKGFSYRLIKN